VPLGTDAFYAQTAIFAIFTSYLTGDACRPRRDHQVTYASSADFFQNFKPLHSCRGAPQVLKSRKTHILLWYGEDHNAAKFTKILNTDCVVRFLLVTKFELS
jgi:hypothetical protein